MNQIQYRDFSRSFQNKTGIKKIPIKGQMELTLRCNLKCVHCYMPENKIRPELDLKEITVILDQIHHEGCLWLSFTGGDPLKRTDFLKIFHYAKKKGFLITLLTNGTLLTKEIAEFFADEPPFSIDLTLNGITQETYEAISKVPGSFKKVMGAIELILKKKLPLKIKTKATRLNIQELDRIRQFVESLGLEFNLDAWLYPRIDGSLEPLKFRISPDEMIGLDKFFQDKKESQAHDLEEEDPIPSNSLIRCAAGVNSFHVNPYGELIFCTFMRRPNFDLKKDSFKRGFYNFYPKIRSLKYQTNSRCRSCRIFYFCKQCPALAALENNNREKPVEYFCWIAHKSAGQGGNQTDKSQKQALGTAK